jgi:ABC-type uncharacterized transport system permease subunit
LSLAAKLTSNNPEEMEGHMWRPITIGVAVTSLVAVMLLLVMGATGKVAAVAAVAQPSYAVTLDSYLPVHELGPVW